MVELLKDLGMRDVGNTRKRYGLYKCGCGNEIEKRTDLIKYNDRHGKGNGCSAKCRRQVIPSLEIIYLSDIEVGGKYFDIQKHFDRFFILDLNYPDVRCKDKEDLINILRYKIAIFCPAAFVVKYHIGKPVLIGKPDNGWIIWEGIGKPDCGEDIVVEVVLRKGVIPSRGTVAGWDWAHRNSNNDIVKYRVVEGIVDETF